MGGTVLNFTKRVLSLLAKLHAMKAPGAEVIAIAGTKNVGLYIETIAAFLKPEYEDTIRVVPYAHSLLHQYAYILGIKDNDDSLFSQIAMLFAGTLKLLTNWSIDTLYIIAPATGEESAPHALKDLCWVLNPTIVIIPEITDAEVAQEFLDAVKGAPQSRIFIHKNTIEKVNPKTIKDARILGDTSLFSLVPGEITPQGREYTCHFQKKKYTFYFSKNLILSSFGVYLEAAAKVSLLMKLNLERSFRVFENFFTGNKYLPSQIAGIEKTTIIICPSESSSYEIKEILKIGKSTGKKGGKNICIVSGEQGINLESITRDILTFSDLLICIGSETKSRLITEARQTLVLNESLFWYDTTRQFSFYIKNMILFGATIVFIGIPKESLSRDILPDLVPLKY